MPPQPPELHPPPHREKDRLGTDYLYNPFTDDIRIVEQTHELPADAEPPRSIAAAARPASKAEAAVNQDARKALRTEWGRLRSIGTWDESGVMEYSDVVRQRKGQTTHFGRLFAILDPTLEIRIETWFCSRSFLAARPPCWQIDNGLFEGNDTQQADAKQAYTQCKLRGTPVWSFLPRDGWPSAWRDMRNPACPLICRFTDTLTLVDIGNSIVRDT
eukprot:2500588-Pyramimonas_sp.AAC.1